MRTRNAHSQAILYGTSTNVQSIALAPQCMHVHANAKLLSKNQSIGNKETQLRHDSAENTRATHQHTHQGRVR